MPHSISQFVRWLLIVPLGIAGAWSSIAIAIALHGVATRLCPAELLISGMCTASWFEYAEDASFCVAAALGAALAVALPSLAAPRFRRQVATAAFAAGGLFASYSLVSVGLSALGPFIFAVVAGLSTMWCIHARLRGDP